MREKKENFVPLNRKIKVDYKLFWLLILIINILAIANLGIVFSNRNHLCKFVEDALYDHDEGQICECNIIGNNKYSLFLKYTYMQNDYEKWIVTDKKYDKETQVELLINKFDDQSIRIYDKKQMNYSIYFFIIIVMIADIISLIIYLNNIYANKRLQKINKDEISIEYKNINETIISDKRINMTNATINEWYKNNILSNCVTKRINKLINNEIVENILFEIIWTILIINLIYLIQLAYK